jgi:DMSO/TMAO reductase YedYZ molybdopterin-dependent catalytic subunit
MRYETRVATLECAGNGRVFLVPQVQGAQWELGAAGNAEWTGVPLRVLLERADLADDACEIVLEGADRGMPQGDPRPCDPISYVWSVPRAKALQPEVLIAYQMNGQDLALDHGFPIRAIVPGHYGMASVKWLKHIEAVREPFHGYWQTTDYAYWAPMNGKPVRRALGRNAARVRNRATARVRNAASEPDLHDLRRGMGRRDRRNRCCGEHRWRPNLGRRGISRPSVTACLATLEIRLANT